MNSLTKSSGNQELAPGGFELKFHWRILGAVAPVFPGFEIDICDKVDETQKPDAIWHRNRARQLLKAHPEIKSLFGRSRLTAFWCVSISLAQILIAILLASQSLWVILLVAYTFGTIANFGLFNLAHECNHGLVFKNKRWNRWLFTVTSLPMMLPAHHTWWIEHHVHHNELGAKQDFVKRRRSILLAMKDRIFSWTITPGLRPWITWITTPLFWPVTLFVLIAQLVRSIVGLTVYAASAIANRDAIPGRLALAILADEHLISGYKKYGIEIWAVTYSLLSIAMAALLMFLAGWQSLFYLLMSALFMTGFLHPLAFGLILSNSHFYGVKSRYQPTLSYYGWLNWITFNFGLHVEHHDLAAIPWHRLGRLREIAPEMYDGLLKTRSYAKIGLQFAFGSREAFNNEEYRNQDMLAEKIASCQLSESNV